MAHRAGLLRQVSERLGPRRLVWVGTRSEDAEAITDLPQMEAAFSIISAMGRRAAIESASLEQLTMRRPDLDTYDLDNDPRTGEVGELRAAILRALARPSALFTYRPTLFTTGIAFSRHDRCRYLGMFQGHQSAFEHKPWLETSIANLGVPRIPWIYVADIDQPTTLQLLRSGPVMLRPSRTTGGVGLVRVEDPEQIASAWPAEREAYVSVAPFIDGGIPVNIGAVAWDDGVTVHPASVQLIGIPGCTTRRFGYCGNDFGAIRQFEDNTHSQLHESTLVVGDWLRRSGYRGAFGVDYLVKDGVPLFTEVNPRFQGSTHASCQISVEANESCLLLEHLAALLGIPAPRSRHVRELAHASGALAHLVVHNTGEDAVIDPAPVLQRFRSIRGHLRADVTTSPQFVTEAGATIARLTIRDRVTETGFELHGPAREAMEDLTGS